MQVRAACSGNKLAPVVISYGVGVAYYSESTQAGLFGFRTPVEAKVFSSSCHADRPWGPTSLLYNGCRHSFPGIKRPERVVDYPPPSVYIAIPVIFFCACMAESPVEILTEVFPFIIFSALRRRIYQKGEHINDTVEERELQRK